MSFTESKEMQSGEISGFNQRYPQMWQWILYKWRKWPKPNLCPTDPFIYFIGVLLATHLDFCFVFHFHTFLTFSDIWVDRIIIEGDVNAQMLDSNQVLVTIKGNKHNSMFRTYSVTQDFNSGSKRLESG